MQPTDQEIIEIIIRRKRRIRRRKRIIRRVSILALILILSIISVVVIINRNSEAETRGTIFIDPGHGGMDSGSTVGNRYEKDDTLKLSLKIKENLEDMGFRVIMSRDDDEYIESTDKCNAANSNNAQLFISIHRNKAVEGNGVEIYIPKDNNPDSSLLANNILSALVDQGFYARGVKVGTLVSSSEDYTENSKTNMPSCLVEVGFIQDSGDNEIFDSKLNKNAVAIATAISETFASIYEPADIE